MLRRLFLLSGGGLLAGLAWVGLRQRPAPQPPEQLDIKPSRVDAAGNDWKSLPRLGVDHLEIGKSLTMKSGDGRTTLAIAASSDCIEVKLSNQSGGSVVLYAHQAYCVLGIRRDGFHMPLALAIDHRGETTLQYAWTDGPNNVEHVNTLLPEQFEAIKKVVQGS